MVFNEVVICFRFVCLARFKGLSVEFEEKLKKLLRLQKKKVK